VAADKGWLDVAKLLVTRNGDLDAQNSTGAKPLQFALEEGHEDVVKMFLEHGASRDTIRDGLVQACQQCDIEDVRMLLRCGADPKTKQGDGNIPLLIAADRGQLEIAKHLLIAGANVDTVGEDGCSALIIAAQKGELEFARHLLDNRANPKKKSKDGSTALLFAVKNSNVKMAKLLMDKGASLSSEQHVAFEKPLIAAVEKNKEDGVQCLLQCGVDAKALNDKGHTLIMIALEKGHRNIVEILAEKGLVKKDIDALGKHLCEACAAGDEERAKFLLSVGASSEIKSSKGGTPLVIAVEKGLCQLSKLLLEKGANKKAKNRKGQSLLFIAAEGGYAETVELLKKNHLAFSAIEQEASVDKILKASESGDLAKFQILLNCGASVNSKDSSNETVLHKAAGGGHTEMIKLLLEQKASIQPQGGEDGKTPLFYASREKHLEAAQLLVAHGANAKGTDEEGSAKYEALLALGRKQERSMASAQMLKKSSTRGSTEFASPR